MFPWADTLGKCCIQYPFPRIPKVMKSPAIKKKTCSIFGLRISLSAPCNMTQNQWTNFLSAYQFGELDFFNAYARFLLSVPREHGAPWALASKPCDAVPSHRPHMPQPNLPCSLTAPQTGQQKHQHHMPRWYIPNVTQKTFTPSFWWILSSL